MIYLNGKFIPLEEAYIPVLDRGFIFGDGVYEVIPVYSRKPFRIERHLKRLQHGLDFIRLKNPFSNLEWIQILEQIIAKNEGDDQSVYLHITRGVAKRDHAFPVNTQPTIFIMSNPLQPPSFELLSSGITAVTANDNRWLRCDIKSISLLPNVLLRQIAVDANAAETILIRDGFLTEGAASSILVAKDNILLIPPNSHYILPSVTCEVLLELVIANKIAHETRNISEEELRNADEIFLISSLKEIVAVTHLDTKPIGKGKPGALFLKLHTLYQDYKARYMRGHSCDGDDS